MKRQDSGPYTTYGRGGTEPARKPASGASEYDEAPPQAPYEDLSRPIPPASRREQPPDKPSRNE